MNRKKVGGYIIVGDGHTGRKLSGQKQTGTRIDRYRQTERD